MSTDTRAGTRRLDTNGQATQGVPHDVPGRRAQRPRDIPSEGQKSVLLRVKDEIRADNVALLAGGVAFFAFLAIFPAIVAAVTLWGLVAEPAQIEQSIQGFSGALPNGLTDFLTTQVTQTAQSSSSALGWGLGIGVAAALWSASSGMKGVMNAINSAYDETEGRGFLEVRGTALVLTLAAIVFVLATIAVIAAIPVALEALALPTWLDDTIRWGRWPILAIAMIGALAVLYRHAGDRDQPRWRWVTWGSFVATVLWLIASAGFAWYAESFGQSALTERYGTFASIVVLLLWLFLSAFAVLLGAELNAELEHQTARDTTVGDPQPMGDRGAHVADTTPSGQYAAARDHD